MKAWAKRESRVWVMVLVAVVAHEVLTRVLDRAGLVERMLSPWGSGLLLSGAAAVLMFGLRLWLVFVMPGWLVARAVIAWRERAG